MRGAVAPLAASSGHHGSPLALGRHRQDADARRGPRSTARSTSLAEWNASHRRVAAVMIARQVPIVGAWRRARRRRRENSPCSATAPLMSSRQSRTRTARGKRPRWRSTRRRRIVASRPGRTVAIPPRFLARATDSTTSARCMIRSCSWSSISSMRRRRSSSAEVAGGHGELSAKRKAIEIVRPIAESKENIDILAPCSLAMPALGNGLRGLPVEPFDCHIWRQRHEHARPVADPRDRPRLRPPRLPAGGDGAVAARLRRRRSAPFTIAYQTYGTLNAERSNAILDLPRADRRPVRRRAASHHRQAGLVGDAGRARQGARHRALFPHLRQCARRLHGLDRADGDQSGDRQALGPVLPGHHHRRHGARAEAC